METIKQRIKRAKRASAQYPAWVYQNLKFQGGPVERKQAAAMAVKEQS